MFPYFLNSIWGYTRLSSSVRNEVLYQTRFNRSLSVVLLFYLSTFLVRQQLTLVAFSVSTTHRSLLLKFKTRFSSWSTTFPLLIWKLRQTNLMRFFRNSTILGLHNTWSWKGTLDHQCTFNATSQILKVCAIFYRASIEPNYHDLYLKFFDKVNSNLLNKEIVKATYENCKVMPYFFFVFPSSISLKLKT